MGERKTKHLTYYIYYEAHKIIDYEAEKSQDLHDDMACWDLGIAGDLAPLICYLRPGSLGESTA